MTLIKPPALRPGDTIGIIAPSSAIESDRLDAGVAVVRDLGYKVQIHPQTLSRDHQSAGSPQEKAAALHEIFLSPEVKAVIGARGGNGSVKALGLVDFKVLASSPKIYMGFSDSTALGAALWSKAGMSSVHGPFIKGLPMLNSACTEHAFALLSGKTPAYPMGGARVLRTGKAEGLLFGGTLSLLSALVGTGYLPDLRGAILFIEDINEELSRIDRALWHLKQALPFSSLGGLVFGRFVSPLDTGAPYGRTIEDMIKEHTEGLDIPVVIEAPFSHEEREFFALPVGGAVKLSATADDAGLDLHDPVVTI